MKIALSGTPGTGKTEVSKILARELNYNLIDINTFARKNNLIMGKDNNRKTQIINEKKLYEKSKEIPTNTIIEGHLAHHSICDITIILRTDPIILRIRLKKRNWPEKKIQENIESEIIDLILQESITLNKNTYEIDTSTNSPKETAKIILNIIKNQKSKKEHKPGKISWEKYI